MADRTGFFEIIDQPGDIFYNTKAEDMVIYTETSNQNIMIGNVASNLPAITITASNTIWGGGRVGINNTNPVEQLDLVGNAQVDGSVNTTKYVVSRGMQVLTRSANQYSATSLPSGIVMGISNDSTGVVFSIASNAPTNSYRFLAASNEVMRLTGTGDVQVAGHILPYSNISYDLGSSNLRFRDLYLNSNTIFLGDAKIRRTPQGVAILDANDLPTPSVASQLTLSNNGVATLSTTNSNLTMSTAGQERIRITDTGLVGVGTAGPNYRLDVGGDINFTGSLRQNGSPYVATQWSNNSNNIFVFGSNIGIGVSNALEAFHVSSKIYSDTQVLNTSNDSATAPSFSFREDSNTGMFHPSNDTIGFSTAGQERMRINDQGLIGVGITSNMAATLHSAGPTTSNQTSSVLSSGLVAWYKLDDNGLDSSSNAYHLTLTGSNITYRSGQYGQAPAFTNPILGTGYGNTWFSSTTVGNTVATTPPLTVACWFNHTGPTVSGSWQPCIFFIGSNNFSQGIEANININNRLIVGIQTQTTAPQRYPVNASTYTTALTSNTWYHLAITYDGATCSAFLNGTNIGSNTACTGNLFPGQLRIGDGGSTTGNASGFNGLVDDFRIYNRVLPTSEIVTLCTATSNVLPAFQDDLTRDLRGWYRLEGNGLDSSACNWHTTATGTPLYIPGQVGQAAFFPNVTSSNQAHYLQASGYTGQGYNPPVTISCWANMYRLPTGTAESAILNIGDTTNGHGYLITYYGNSGITFFVRQSGTWNAVGSSVATFQPRTWYHLVFKMEGTTASSFVNGTRVALVTLPSATPEDTSSIRIGARINSSTALGFNGAIDDVRIYGRTLSDSEIATLYTQGTNGIGNGNSLVTTGQVGIGTPTPQYPLDVVGSINATGAFTCRSNIGVGTSNPIAAIDMSQRTDAVILPQGTTAQRPTVPVAGMFRFNTSIGAVEYYTGAAWSAPFFNGALFYNDGSTLSGWTVSGATVNTSVGNPAPSLSAGTGQYAYILPPGVSTLLNTTIIFNMQLMTAVCANLFFGNNSTGAGYMVRLDARANTPSGIATTTNWTTWALPTGPNLSVASGVWHSVKLQISGSGTVTFFLNGTQQHQLTSLTLQGAYIGITGDGGGAYYDSISIYSGII